MCFDSSGGVNARSRRVGELLHLCHKLLCALPAIVSIVRTKFHQQKSVTFRQQVHVRRLLAAKAVNDAAFNAFESNRLKLQDLGHMVSGNESIIEAQRYQ